MNKLGRRVCFAVFLAGLAIVGNGYSDQRWTPAQQEIIESIKSCWLAESREDWLRNCYHEDFAGWYKDSPELITIADKRSQDEAIWTDYNYELVHFTPYRIHIEDDLAITVYSAQLRWTEIATGEVTVGAKERWMEALVRQEGRWLGIAEHASWMPED